MEAKLFKKIFNDTLLLKDFIKKGNYQYLYTEDLIIVIGLQKSNFSNAYYINIGYVIKQLNPSISSPRDIDGDIRARFTLSIDGKKTDLFDLDILLDNDSLKNQLEENIKNYVESIYTICDLKLLLEKRSTMLYQTKLSAKVLLGFD